MKANQDLSKIELFIAGRPQKLFRTSPHRRQFALTALCTPFSLIELLEMKRYLPRLWGGCAHCPGVLLPNSLRLQKPPPLSLLCSQSWMSCSPQTQKNVRYASTRIQMTHWCEQAIETMYASELFSQLKVLQNLNRAVPLDFKTDLSSTI